MDEDLLKSNTDCVYFLASPFTCKKGVECEYRHSDVARLNPRDCWYWMSGNCLNPVCAFRHPPLDVHNEASTESSSLNPSSISSTKTTVPCYFYYNGFCSKGHKCPFLHEPSQSFSRDPKISSNTPVILSDKGVDVDHIPTKDPSVPSKTEVVPTDLLHNEQKFIKSNSPEKIYVPQCEKIPTFSEGITKSEVDPSLDSDQSSEELIDGQIVREEWESSPGFDVLVNGKNEEDLVDEDDPEYLHALENDHGFAHQTEFDERGFFENNEFFEPPENEPRPDFGEYSLRQTRYDDARCVFSHKRKYASLESRVGACHDVVDLRDYLRKRRMDHRIHETHDLSHELVLVREGYREERYRRYGSTRLEHRKLASKVERNETRFSTRRNSLYNLEHQGRNQSGFRQYSGRKPRKFLTDRNSYSKREKHTREFNEYSKPKNGSIDFEGPKPLSEILKVKKNMVSTSN